MKRIDLDESSEKTLVSLLDALFRNCGFHAVSMVQFILNKVYEVPSSPPKED